MEPPTHSVRPQQLHRYLPEMESADRHSRRQTHSVRVSSPIPRSRFHIAKVAQEAGAELVLTGFDRMKLIRHRRSRLPNPAPLIELDAERTSIRPCPTASSLRSVRATSSTAVVHSDRLHAPDRRINLVLRRSIRRHRQGDPHLRLSYASLANAVLPISEPGRRHRRYGLLTRLAQCLPNWMTVARCALESVNRFVAREAGKVGVRSNLVAAGPIRRWR